jgi:phosphoribosylamine--glycine ligase
VKVVVVGAGGREHAIVKALQSSSLVSTVYAWPGNDGIFLDASRVSSLVKDRRTFVRWAKEERIDLVVIGPENELVDGWADDIRDAGILVFGPSQEAAQLEESKVFSKQFMLEFGIPTARAAIVNSKLEIAKCMERFSPPYVLKAEGLAAGKGVFICRNDQQLINAGAEIFDHKRFGDNGKRALLEEFLPGEELSILVMTNGEDHRILPFCRDHKRLFDNDLGPNTGGMGVVAPVGIPQSINSEIRSKVVEPTIRGLKARGYLYRGIIFIGVMLTKNGPQVLEYNVRWGDPEAQAIMPLLDGDWAAVFKQVAEGSLPELNWRRAATACLVLAAEGYPDSPVKGVEIYGASANGDEDYTDVAILHAGTKRLENGRFVTNGGRVINIVARASTMGLAIEQAYQGLSRIHWPGMQYRRDIGKSAT